MATEGEKAIDAVVVTHDSFEDVQALMASRETLGAFRRIVLVDNASTDETCALARGAGLDVIALRDNRGFAAAANIGAARTEGPVFALLNPDIAVFERSDVTTLSRGLSDPTVGAVAPALLLPDGVVQDSARRVPSPFDLVVRRLAGRTPDAVRSTAAVDVDWTVGACLLLRRAAFDAVGGFDERYFLYFEDVDLCVCMARGGFRVRYDPTVTVAHRHRAASRGHLTSVAARHHVRSALRFYRRHPRYLVPRRARRPRAANVRAA